MRTTGGASCKRSATRCSLMAPQFVKPYVKTNKNDAADAEAICEAVARPNMRFVPIKSVEQQADSVVASGAPGVRQGAHGAGQSDPWAVGRVRRGHAAGHHQCAESACRSSLEDGSNELPAAFRHLIDRLVDALQGAGSASWRSSKRKLRPGIAVANSSQKLEKIPGIGPLAASALVASIADAQEL